jgi:ribonuclease HII
MHKDFDDKLREKYGPNIVGCDEVGRGSWALSLVAAAVCLPNNFVLPGLTDSKNLSEKNRNEFDRIIKANAISYSIVEIDAKTIDEKGITWANAEAMKRCCLNVKEELGTVNLFVLDQSPHTSLNPCLMLPKADSTSMSTAAASVLAKVYRDNLALEFHEKYPEYGFDKHKGYINKNHINNVNKYGMVEGAYRKSYKVKGYNHGKNR